MDAQSFWYSSGAAGGGGGDPGDPIGQSLRFRGNGNFLRRVQTAGDRRTFTYSVWFKKTNSGGDPNNSGAGYFELLGEAGMMQVTELA